MCIRLVVVMSSTKYTNFVLKMSIWKKIVNKSNSRQSNCAATLSSCHYTPLQMNSKLRRIVVQTPVSICPMQQWHMSTVVWDRRCLIIVKMSQFMQQHWVKFHFCLIDFTVVLLMNKQEQCTRLLCILEVLICYGHYWINVSTVLLKSIIAETPYLNVNVSSVSVCLT